MEISTSWHAYPKVFALGHGELKELFLDPVLVEEKIDGSQFSFGRFGGELKVRSRGKVMFPDNPEKMFQGAVDAVAELDLVDGLTYRGEMLNKPKHNALSYDRVPVHNVILFDINPGHEQYYSRAAKEAEAARVGLEIVPVLFEGMVTDVEEVLCFLDRTSILGGQKMEGVVFKNYSRFGRDKKALMGKYVSEAFKEIHDKAWKKSNPTKTDIQLMLIERYRNDARWQKAVIHMKEAGELTGTPKDIGGLMKRVQQDIRDECEEEIKEKLYSWAISHITRGAVGGLPEWYKKELLTSQFEEF